MIGRSNRALRPANRASVQSQSFKSLRTGDLVDQVQIDVQDGGSIVGAVNDMLVPDFVEHGPRSGQRGIIGHGHCGWSVARPDRATSRTLVQNHADRSKQEEISSTVNSGAETVNGLDVSR